MKAAQKAQVLKAECKRHLQMDIMGPGQGSGSSGMGWWQEHPGTC